MPSSLSGACPVGGFDFSCVGCQRRLLPQGAGSEMMEKQSRSLAGVPGITCVACLIFFGPWTESKSASRPHRRLWWNHLQAHGIWTHRRLGGQWDPFSSKAWPHLPRGGSVLQQGAGKGLSLGRVCKCLETGQPSILPKLVNPKEVPPGSWATETEGRFWARKVG